MKSFKKVALAAAVAAVAAGNAFAVVNISTGAGLVNYSRELASAGQALSGTSIDLDIPLGFGVSTGQTRYVRVVLNNATFDGNVGDADLVNPNITPVKSFGGAAGGTVVIFQITANNNVASSDTIQFQLGTAGIIVGSASSNVTVSYSLYESGADALAGGSAGRLSELSNKSIAAFVKSTELVVTPSSALTAQVTSDFKTFTGANAGFGQLATVKVGIRDLIAGGALDAAKKPNGTDVAFADLYGNGSVVTLTTDATLASAAEVYLRSGACTGASGGGDIVGTIAGSTASFVLDANIGDDTAAWNLCYVNNGTTPIAKQDFTLSGTYQPVGGPSGPRADDEAAQAAGSIVRNGTLLKGVFPEVASNTGYALSVHLNNQSASAVPFTTVCYTQSTKVNGLGGSVAGNTAQRIGLNSATGLGCPNGTRAVELTMGVRTGTVIGSVVRQNTTTGVASFESMLGSQESVN